MIGGVIDLASRIGNILVRLKSLLDEHGPLAAYQYLTLGNGKVRYIREKIAALVIQDLSLLLTISLLPMLTAQRAASRAISGRHID